MLSSPRRIAVVVLAGLIGFALQTWASVDDAVTHGILIGMLVSLFVPAGTKVCSIKPR